MLNRQGIQATTILGGMGEAAAYLGVLLKKTPRETAEFAAKLQDATRTTEKDMLSLMDVIQRTFYLGVDDNNMLTGFTKLSPAMDTIRNKGLSAAKALAPLLVMADQTGMKGEAAGNAFRKIFQLSMNREKVTGANKLMGSTGKLDFTNGKGEFGGLDQMFSQFAKLKQLSTQQQLSVIKKLFGDDAETLQAVSIIINKGIEGYREVQQKMEAQATLQDRVNVQLGTLRNLWEATTGTATNVLVSLGESISPEIKDIVAWLGELTEATGKWVKEHPRMSSILMKTVAVLGILLTATGGLMLATAAIIGPYALLAAGFARLGISGGILLPVLRGIGQAVLFIGRTLLMNPIGLTLTGIALAALLIYKYWEPITAFFASLPDKFRKYGSLIVTGLIEGILSMTKWMMEKVKTFAVNIAETFQASMGIHSPSRLFSEYGGYLTEGLATGIDRGQNQPLQQLKTLTENIGKISSGILFDKSVTEGIRIDKRPPVLSGAALAAAGTGETRIEITINPAPGMDPNTIAHAVARELDRREREKAIRQRGRYIDY